MMKRICALILALMLSCLSAFAAAEVAAPKEDAQAEDFAGAWVCSYVVTLDGRKLDAATNLEVMNTQEVPTIAHLTAESATTSRVNSAAEAKRPESAITATYAAQPKQVETSSVGSTALSRTLAFFARS